ncbi:MAG TPA: hypothetical protein VN577_10170 [Terriglobales bacterium]|nr:hypothetical protein [Terriglobales bacterium]
MADDRFQLPIKQFVQGVFSDNGAPSSSRVVSFILSMGSLLILAVLFRHLMCQPADKLAVWLPNLPYIIGALAVFSQSPYGVNRIGDWLLRKKDNKPPEEPKAEPTS